jgi:tricorn protease
MFSLFRNTRSKSFYWLAGLLALCIGGSAQAALPRYPQAFDGKIVFSANENLWTVSQNGGVAVQLTSGAHNDIYPRVSPDGRWIAYTEIGSGGSDVWIVPAAGGAPRRLTYHHGQGLDNIVVTWAPDSRHVLYLSQHAQWNRVVREMYQVPVEGGLPARVPVDAAGMASYGPDGHAIAYNQVFVQYGNWKRYDGGMARQIDVVDLTTHARERVTDWKGTNAYPMWYGRKIYYLSDQDAQRRANIWVVDLDTHQRRQITHFTDFDIDTPALGDGAIAFQQGGALYRLRLADERLDKVHVTVPDNARTLPRTVPVAKLVRGGDGVHDSDLPDRVDYALAPDGARSLLAARGHLFSVPTSAGIATDLTRRTGIEEDHPSWSPDGRLIAYVTDVAGTQQIALRPAEGGRERLLTQFKSGYLFGPAFAPDGRRLAFSDGEHRLWLANVDGAAPRQVAQDKRQGIHDQIFSPDGRWLAFSMAAGSRRRDLYLYDIAAAKVHRLGRGNGTDANPSWSPDGKRLYFTSARNVNPAASEQEVDFVLLKSSSINVITMPDAGAPFDPAGLLDQAVAVPVGAANIVQLDARQDRLFYLTQPVALFTGALTGEQPALHAIDVVRETDSVVAGNVESYSLSADGGKVLVKQGDEYAVLNTDGTGRHVLALDRLSVTVDPRAEWAQMFDSAWRLERDLFISPAMNGQDWPAVHARYRKLLPLLGSRTDLHWLLGEMLGELGNSHVYVGGGDDGHQADGPPPARLGADWAVDAASGRYRLARIYGGDNTLPDYRSPLYRPGLAIREGDYVLAINGVELRAPVVPDALLDTLAASRPVDLTVAATPEGARRQVRVMPVASELPLREHAWIAHNREQVEQLSGGRLAYVYLSNMGQRGLEQFSRQFYAQLDKQGLILDDRWNSGGSVAEYLLERLRRKQIASTGNRTGAFSTQPEAFIGGPKTVLVNHWTASNGELFPFLFQQYGLGPVIGTRTWGGLRGYNGDTPLVDGGYITIPVRAVYDMQGRPGVENHGVDPDVAVDNLPREILAGHDAQLEKAVALTLRALGTQGETAR